MYPTTIHRRVWLSRLPHAEIHVCEEVGEWSHHQFCGDREAFRFALAAGEKLSREKLASIVA